MSLRSYLTPGSKPEFVRFSEGVERKIARRSLGHLSRHMTDARLIGKGSSKDCYQVDDRKVLVVQERSGGRIHSELIALDLLRKAGFPVVKTFDAGMIPSRYGNGFGTGPRNMAMVQERLEDFVAFERFTPESVQALLASPRMNRNTLDSLADIRDRLHQKKLVVGDLQGGLREDGVFVLADVGGLSPAPEANFLHKRGMKNLDQAIDQVATALNGG